MRWINRAFSHLKGQEAEKQAERFLISNGLTPLDRNYRCRQGEIDLIMMEHNTLIFVEVKYRKSDSHGNAADFFDTHKRKKVEFTIRHYLHHRGLNPNEQALRLDVVAMTGDKIEWLQNV